MEEGDPGGHDHLTRSQREWRDWSAHGYRKMYQPRSVLWLGGVAICALVVGLATLFYLAAHGKLP